MAMYKCGAPVQGGAELIPEGKAAYLAGGIGFLNESQVRNIWYTTGWKGYLASLDFIIDCKKSILNDISAYATNAANLQLQICGVKDGNNTILFSQSSTNTQSYNFSSDKANYDYIIVSLLNNTDTWSNFKYKFQ